MADAPCKLLEWDSEFFGVRIARITGERLTEAQGRSVLDWAQSHAIDCLYFLCDMHDAESVLVAERMKGHLTDVRVELRLDLAPGVRFDVSEGDIREAAPEDVPQIMRLASVSHRDTRFYYDGHFPRETCDQLYARWIERSCEGYADKVFVQHVEGRPAGYISCHLLPDGGASLGLLGVEEWARGKGIGTALVRTGLNYFVENDHNRLTIATQARNTVALRLYVKHGFQLEQARLWYHFWPKADSPTP